jgi:putative membrane protein
MIDLLLAIAHRVLVFTLAGLLAAELVLLRPGIDRARLVLVSSIDRAYGGLAGAVIAVGVLRVFFGFKGSEAYLTNPAFWSKMGAFAIVGLLSIQPTMAIIRWRRAADADAGFAVPADAVARSRMFLWAEVVVFALIPVFAAMMARGYGL